MLTAIAIPVFTTQLEKSREATDIANVRSAYANLVANYITNTESASAFSMDVPAKQKDAKWQTIGNSDNYLLEQMVDGSMTAISVPYATGSYNVKIDTSGSVSVTATQAGG